MPTTRGAEQSDWYLLIHQVPKHPLYLRAKIRNRLEQVGALSLKNSVYVLPQRPDCLEDFQWVAQEAVAGGGEAFVCRVGFVEGITTEKLVEGFRAQANALFEPLKEGIAVALRPHGKHAATTSEAGRGAHARLTKRFHEIRAVDFFDATLGKESQRMLEQLHRRNDGKTPFSRGRAGTSRQFMGRTWVTRTDPKVDRLSSAWLILRFLDPRARFRFMDPLRGAKRQAEISFDMVGGDFTHEGNLCTFEVLRSKFIPKNRAVDAIGEIVHDLDLKDEKYGRPETPGIKSLIAGLLRTQANDEKRLMQALPLFDALYASFKGGAETKAPSKPKSRAGRA